MGFSVKSTMVAEISPLMGDQPAQKALQYCLHCYSFHHQAEEARLPVPTCVTATHMQQGPQLQKAHVQDIKLVCSWITLLGRKIRDRLKSAMDFRAQQV